MALVTAAAAASLAYLDAKLSLGKDIKTLRIQQQKTRHLIQAVRSNRVSLYYLVEAAANRRGDKEAIWSRAGTLSWNDTLARSNMFAQWFLLQGVRPGDFVAFFMMNSPDFICAWVGLLAIGAAPAMVNYHLNSQALVHCLDISTATLILADGSSEALTRLENLGSKYRVANVADVRNDITSLEPKRPSDDLRNGVTGDSPMALFYTSGTTGMPKACALPTFVGFMSGIGSTIGANIVNGSDERYYNCMPYYHGTGGISVLGQLMNGTTICVAPKFSVSTFWDDIRDSGATWFVYVGETLRYLLAAPPSPRDKDHNVHTCYGNGLRPDVWKRFRDRFGIVTINELFNSSEAMLSLDNPCRGDFLAHAVGHEGFLLRWKNHDTYIPVAVNPDTGEILRDPETGFARRVPYEVGGEILVALGEGRQFRGYFNNPVATAKKIVCDVFRKGDRYYRTGDALRRDSDGRWFFMDRLGDTFRWKGENVSTAEVSEVLGKYPGVVEANVYGVELPGHDGKAGAAALLIEPDHKPKFCYKTFLRHARTHLPKYAVPLFLRHVNVVPSMHNNKQNKVPLKQEGVDPAKVQNGDEIYWVESFGKGASYVPFTKKDWDNLCIGRARL
ncbi:Fatty acid transporter [Pleurostoma richardsiae]|uniref:Fatty acid transporter n=1 Tax=Pleurostoma richardsiae TaxID=41990 RepID=A0AA38RWI9_9PEZI|nr:Fatty acid transporter [Pleurostoma richardsiae]